jgi:hypothetical protein
MKLSLFAICTLLFTTSLLAQNVNIPDAIFKEYLLTNTAINTNGDGEISVAEAETFMGEMLLYNMGIKDLSGIESFINLNSLACSQNDLKKLDLSKNINLVSLGCGFNEITNLDFSNNIKLEFLDCGYNQLNSIDVAHLSNLETFAIYGTKITALDLSKNLKLTTLRCYLNKLTKLDVSNNILLTSINCSNNHLEELDLRNNTALSELICNYNSLQNIDFGGNCGLSEFNAANNRLMSLDLRTDKSYTTISYDLSNNPFLNCISVDDPIFAQENITKIDEHVVFTTDCSNNFFEAQFTVDTVIGKIGLEVNFTDKSTGLPTDWKWDFGDGEYSTEQNPTHIYNQEGVYSIILKVENNDSRDSIIKKNLILVSNDYKKNVNIPDANFKNYLINNLIININLDY